MKDSDDDESSSDSEESERGRKSRKEKKKSKKEKDKRRDRHHKNTSAKKKPNSSSESELSSKTAVKLLGRSIDFIGHDSDGSYDRDHKKTNRMKVEGGVLHKEEIRKRENKSVNGIKNSRGDCKHSDEKNHRKRSREGDESCIRKKQRQ